MQKFTRPITREVELNGQRLALTFTEQGMTVRPVGSRKPPRDVTWTELMAHVLGTTPAAEATHSELTHSEAAHSEPPPPPNPLAEPVGAGAGADNSSPSLGS